MGRHLPVMFTKKLDFLSHFHCAEWLNPSTTFLEKLDSLIRILRKAEILIREFAGNRMSINCFYGTDVQLKTLLINQGVRSTLQTNRDKPRKSTRPLHQSNPLPQEQLMVLQWNLPQELRKRFLWSKVRWRKPRFQNQKPQMALCCPVKLTQLKTANWERTGVLNPPPKLKPKLQKL